MIRIIVDYFYVIVKAPPAYLAENLVGAFTYTNKAASYSLFRYKKGTAMRMRRMAEKYGEVPDWYRESERKRVADMEAAAHPTMVKRSGADLVTSTGLLPSLLEHLRLWNVEHQVIDERRRPERHLPFVIPDTSLRRPQELAVKAAIEAAAPGWGLIVLPTGVGKTRVAEYLIAYLGLRTIFLVPSRSILDQTVKRFRSVFGERMVSVYGGGKRDVGPITVATYQSVSTADPSEFKDIEVIIPDEAHHVGSEMFTKARLNIENAFYVFGLSATPKRLDGADLVIEAGCGPIIYEYPLKDAVAEGFLAEPRFVLYEIASTKGTFEKIKETKKGEKRVTVPSVQYKGPDLVDAYRHWILGNDSLGKYITFLASSYADDGESVLIMVDEIQHGQKLAALMPSAGFAYGGNKDNALLQKRFNARELRILIGTSTIGEGTDLVPTSVLIDLSGGTSPGQIMQRVGRALRSDPDENGVPRKKRALIIDFDPTRHTNLHKHAAKREKLYRGMGKVNRLDLDLSAFE